MASAWIAFWSPSCPSDRVPRFNGWSRKGTSRSPAKGRRPTRKVKTGQEVTVDLPEPTDPVPQPEALPLPILYQDGDLIVVDKPAGMVVHPAAGHETGTLVNALLHHVDDLSGIGGEKRPGIVHRLDRGTSGLMVVAKNDAVHEEESGRQFHDREVQKEYLALVWGEVMAGRRIDAPIGRDPADRKKMTAASARVRRSRSAVTRIVREAEHFRAGADARTRGNSHRAYAPDSRPPECDRSSHRRRCGVWRRAASGAGRFARPDPPRASLPARGATRVQASDRWTIDGVRQSAARGPSNRARCCSPRLRASGRGRAFDRGQSRWLTANGRMLIPDHQTGRRESVDRDR